MTYKEARVYLDEMSKYGSVLGLDTIRGLLRELGDPQESLRFIHIAGTNGKGSVLAYTSTILSEAGYRIGRYVSPTVVSYLERIQVDGTWISEEMFAQMTSQVRDAIARLEEAHEPLPTVFEAETAIAFLYFKEVKCDLVVLEAGLGGALDATNIIRNTVCAVFSSISRDHIGVIGNTLEEIAENKAGIIKSGCTVVSADQLPSVTEILKKRAAQNGCLFIEVEPEKAEIHRADYRGMELSYKEYSHLTTSLSGRYQADNLCTALEVIRFLNRNGYPVSEQAVKNGTAHTLWQGRFTCIGESPVFILDGAHNEAAAQRLRETVEDYFTGKKLIFIMGVFKDKEYDRIAEIMCPLAASVYTVQLPDKKRGLPPEELAETVRKYCPHVTAVSKNENEAAAAIAVDRNSDATTVSDRSSGAAAAATDEDDSVSKAVAMALTEAEKEDVILAFGSLSYLKQAETAYENTVTTVTRKADASKAPCRMGEQTTNKGREL